MVTNVGQVTIKDLSFALRTVRVKVERQFYIRLWLGKQLLCLAARIMGCGIEIEE